MVYRVPVLTLALMAANPALGDPAALPNGKPAGVRPAQSLRATELYLFGIVGAVAVGVGVLIVRDKKSPAAPVSTAP
jgi:hypothetical protein